MRILTKWTLAVCPDRGDPGAQIWLRPGLALQLAQAIQRAGGMVPVEAAGKMYLVQADALAAGTASPSERTDPVPSRC